MKSFHLILLGAFQQQRIEGVSSFVGEDASGSFGLQAGHERFMTSLVFGLARFRCGEQPWQFLALPRALAYFLDNELFLCTRRFLMDTDYSRISSQLTDQLLADEENQRSMREHMGRMEEEVLRRLWKLGRERYKGA